MDTRVKPGYDESYYSASAAMRIVTILSGFFTGSPRLILSTFSMPSVTLPQTVYCLSRKRASPKTMKNCELAEFGFDERSMEQMPRTCGSSLTSAGRLGCEEPPVPVPWGQ